MSWKSWAWVVSGTVTAVEVSKERKLCRWCSKNQHQNVIKNVGSADSTQTKKSSPSSSLSSSTSSRMASKRRDTEEKRNQSEESLRTIMYLSCSLLGTQQIKD
ncbi:hypothetical protein CRYUN_Cryun10bG0074900 [Craigia yunnanensis]